MRNAETILDHLGDVINDRDALRRWQADVTAQLGQLAEVLSGQPEVGPDKTVIGAAVEYIGRLRREIAAGKPDA